jgi:N-acetylglucosamine malate deacetylase 1
LAEAHALLGVADACFLDFPAPALDTTPGYRVADAIRGVIDEIRPSTVYIPHGGDIHTDHRATNLAALVATRPGGAASVSKVMAYETLSETGWGDPRTDGFQPAVFVDITKTLEDKLKAMQCYRSQLRPSPNARSLEALRALATYRGHSVGVLGAEAFVLIREIVR